MIEPKVKKLIKRCYIILSFTKSDMANYNWVINHFLAVLPMGIEYLGNIIMQRENLIEMRKLEEKECEIEPPKLPKKLLKAILKLRSTKRGRNGRKHNYPKKKLKKQTNKTSS